MKNICMFTSNRSEWGLLQPLAEKLNSIFNLKVISCGSHLSPTYGFTRNEIAFECKDLECLLSSDTSIGTCKSMGLLCVTIPDVLKEISPELVIILGDRYESMICAMICHTMRIRVLHIHGGEQSGSIDNAFRDCISRVAYIHCVATQKSKKRLKKFLSIINASHDIFYYNIFNVGALGCFGLQEKRYYNDDDDDDDHIIVVYHPNTYDNNEDFTSVLNVLKNRSEKIIFVLANNDYGGNIINRKIINFCKELDGNRLFFKHMKRNGYLKILGSAKCIIGNSSSGIIEAPALKVPTINIGKRQINREKASSIINADCNSKSIENAFNKFDKNEYDFSINPYCTNPNYNPVDQIIDIIKGKLL